MRRFFTLALTLISACSVPPLTTEDLTGGKRDASSVVADAAPAKVDGPSDAGVAPDASEPRLDTAPMLDGVLSGIVVDACTGKAINALVGIAGKHLCSFAGKGGFYFTGLPTGIELELASAAPGYQAFGKAVVISAAGTTVKIVLDRVDASSEAPCGVPEPPEPMCSCLQPGCI
ncbi:MAG: hypothetical protein SF187_05345 [Deltaproteobacteria bacterium]|nr:hypothetical protein [Deltaproteobacteria bacterium]